VSRICAMHVQSVTGAPGVLDLGIVVFLGDRLVCQTAAFVAVGNTSEAAALPVHADPLIVLTMAGAVGMESCPVYVWRGEDVAPLRQCWERQGRWNAPVESLALRGMWASPAEALWFHGINGEPGEGRAVVVARAIGKLAVVLASQPATKGGGA